MIPIISRLMALCRFALVPLFVGLGAALVLLVAAFFMHLWSFFIRLPGASETEVLMSVLTLIDMALVGGLVVIVISSGYESFVEKIDGGHAETWPGWLKRMTFSGLKRQLFASMAAIAAVTLLKALMKLETSVSEAQVKWLVAANIIFICAYAIITIVDHVARRDADGGGH